MRKCGDCSLCCKLPVMRRRFFTGELLDKPQNQWCEHCDPGGQGCKIHFNRPVGCYHYTCMWLAVPTLPEELKPNRCHVIFEAMKTKRIVKVLVDPSYPDASDTRLVQDFIRRLVTRNQISCVVIREHDLELYPAAGADPEWIIRQVNQVPGFRRSATRGHLPKERVME